MAEPFLDEIRIKLPPRCFTELCVRPAEKTYGTVIPDPFHTWNNRPVNFFQNVTPSSLYSLRGRLIKKGPTVNFQEILK